MRPEQIPAASVLNSLRMNVASLAGPALAGMLLASVDMAWVFAIDLATFASAWPAWRFMRRSRRHRRRAAVAALGRVRAAVRRQPPELLGTYLVDINAMFFGMPQALYPFVAAKLGGPAVLGLLYAAPVGRLAAGHVDVALDRPGTPARAGRRPRRRPHGAWRSSGSACPPTVWLALVCLFVAGAADMISGIFRSTIWNQTIPDHCAVAWPASRCSRTRPVRRWATSESGVAARSVGVGGSIVWGGVLCVAGTVALAAALPAFLRYNGKRRSRPQGRRRRGLGRWSRLAPG